MLQYSNFQKANAMGEITLQLDSAKMYIIKFTNFYWQFMGVALLTGHFSIPPGNEPSI